MAAVAALVSAALSETNGIFRLAPNWVPGSFLQPGRPLKSNSNHYCAVGMHRGGIDERWFGATTEASSDNRNWDEVLSYRGTPNGEQFFSAKELTINPGARCTIQDGGAYSWITTQGLGRIGNIRLQTPAMSNFGELTDDEVFVTAKRAGEGAEFENTGDEPLVEFRSECSAGRSGNECVKRSVIDQASGCVSAHQLSLQN